jgi:hypothetical protein
MRVPFGLPEHENGTQIFGQPRHDTLHIPRPAFIGRVASCAAGHLIVECHFPPASLGALAHQHEADQHALEPALKTAVPPELPNSLRQPYEEIVQNILRVLDRGREPAGETKQRSPMRSVEGR